MSFEDKTLTCRECGATFVFSVGEQEFFQAKGLLNQPSRCPNCRANAKRVSRGNTTLVEKTPREIHVAVCADCGKPANLPFLPRHDRPVYCSSCFDKVRAAAATAQAPAPVLATTT